MKRQQERKRSLGRTGTLPRSSMQIRIARNPLGEIPARIVDFGALNSNSSGVLSTYIACDPSTFTVGDWKQYNAMYGEVKLLAAKIVFFRGQSNTAIRPVACAGTLGTTGAPTSYIGVLDNPRSLYFVPAADTSNRGRTLSLKWRNLNFANTATPDPGSFAGCPGGFGVYGDNLTATSTVLDYFIEVIVVLRNRA